MDCLLIRGLVVLVLVLVLLRFISRLKEDDEACAAALENGSILLFHQLDPLLHRTRTGTFTTGSQSSSGTEPERNVYTLGHSPAQVQNQDRNLYNSQAQVQNQNHMKTHRPNHRQNFSRTSLNVVVLYFLAVQAVLEQLGADRTLLAESVLIGCSEQNQAQFCLDVGKNLLNVLFPVHSSGP